VAFRFFGSADGCNRDDCDIDACAMPDIEVGTLTADSAPDDEQEDLLVTAIDDGGPVSGFGTPIYPALAGALQWATEYKDNHQDENTAVVFVTDGAPEGMCIADSDQISGLAEDAAPDVLTYAIGLKGSNEDLM